MTFTNPEVFTATILREASVYGSPTMNNPTSLDPTSLGQRHLAQTSNTSNSSNDDIPFSNLTLISLQAVVTVASCASFGAYAKHTGVLTKPAQKSVGQLVTNIFLPSLILQKVIPNMKLEDLKLLWPMALMCLVTVFWGLCAGYLVGNRISNPYAVDGKGRGLATPLRNLMMVAVAFPNSFSVPLTLMLAIPEKQFGEDESGDDISSRIKLMFVVSYSLWVLARWSIGYPILSGALTFEEWKKKVLNAPVKACLIGIVGGLFWNWIIPEGWREGVEEAMYERNNTVVGTKGKKDVDDALAFLVSILTVIGTALDYAGRCCVPCILLTLGGSLYDAVDKLFKAYQDKQEKRMVKGKLEDSVDVDKLIVAVGMEGKDVKGESVGLAEPLSPKKEVVGGEFHLSSDKLDALEEGNNTKEKDEGNNIKSTRENSRSTITPVETMNSSIVTADIEMAEKQQITTAKEPEKPQDPEKQLEKEQKEAQPDQPVHFPLSAYLSVLILRQVIGPAVSVIIAGLFLKEICGVTDKVVLMVGFLQGAGPPMINLAVMAGITDNGSGQSLVVATLLLITYTFSIVSWTLAVAAFLAVV